VIRASSHVIYTKFLDAILISEPTVLHSKLSAASDFFSVFWLPSRSKIRREDGN